MSDPGCRYHGPVLPQDISYATLLLWELFAPNSKRSCGLCLKSCDPLSPAISSSNSKQTLSITICHQGRSLPRLKGWFVCKQKRFPDFLGEEESGLLRSQTRGFPSCSKEGKLICGSYNEREAFCQISESHVPSSQSLFLLTVCFKGKPPTPMQAGIQHAEMKVKQNSSGKGPFRGNQTCPK